MQLNQYSTFSAASEASEAPSPPPLPQHQQQQSVVQRPAADGGLDRLAAAATHRALLELRQRVLHRVPLLLFLTLHLFVENCKWNFGGEGGAVPRPWPHTLYLLLIWFFSAAYAVPTVFLSQVRSEAEDIYRNDIERRATTANVSR